MRKGFGAGLVLIVLSAITTGSAATLQFSGQSLAGGTGSVSTCGSTAAATVGYTTNGAGDVTAATVSGLPSSCNGAAARLALTAGSTSVATAGPVTVAGGSASFALASPVPAATAATLTSSRVSLEGP